MLWLLTTDTVPETRSFLLSPRIDILYFEKSVSLALPEIRKVLVFFNEIDLPLRFATALFTLSGIEVDGISGSGLLVTCTPSLVGLLNERHELSKVAKNKDCPNLVNLEWCMGKL